MTVLQSEHDFILDPLLSVPALEPGSNSEPPSSLHQQITSFTGPLSVITDEDLDSVILQLCQQFTRAGITILHGMLWQLGYWIPCERIWQSLHRIDPVHCIFGRIHICQCTYSVARPNAHQENMKLLKFYLILLNPLN